MTLRLHTGGLYLTNYVTSEGNWLHQSLFRGVSQRRPEWVAPDQERNTNKDGDGDELSTMAALSV